jgi:hypothetical protein
MWYYRTVYTILEVKSVANRHLLVLFYFVYFVLCTFFVIKKILLYFYIICYTCYTIVV